jgi:outer membrane lipoprotein-sorting protein
MAAQRRRLRAPFTLVVALLATTLACVHLLASPSRDLFDEIYERGRGVDASWKTLTARFTEESTSTLLARPLVAKGTLAVSRSDRVVLQYLEPDRRTVLIDGDTLTVVWPSRGLRTTSDISSSQRRIQKCFVDKTPKELRRQFTIVARIAPDRPGTWHIGLAPSQKRIREGITAIDLWVDRQSLLLAAIAMTFPNGDRKLMEFSDVQLNPPLGPDTFTASMP